MTGPCQGGAYCYPIFDGGYSTVPGQIIAGQAQPPRVVGKGNITGFICNASPVGKPGEQFWSGACPGTWGPNGPFYPTKAAPKAPPNGSCVPPNPPLPPPGYRMFWKKVQVGAGGAKFNCIPVYEPLSNNPPTPSSPDCKCGKNAPAQPGKTVSDPGKHPITGEPKDNPPAEGCGPVMATGGENMRRLFGFDIPEHFEGGAVSGNLVTIPVHDGAGATASPAWTHRPRVIKNKLGIYQLWDGTADGNLVLLPPELNDYQAYGDGTLHGDEWPDQISQHGLLIHSQARNGSGTDDSDGILAFGCALRTSRKPASGWYLQKEHSTGVLQVVPTTADGSDSSAALGLEGWLRVPEIPAPSTPASGKVILYAKSDGLLYSKDDAGDETLVSGGAGGGSGDMLGANNLSDVASDDSSISNLVTGATTRTPILTDNIPFLDVGTGGGKTTPQALFNLLTSLASGSPALTDPLMFYDAGTGARQLTIQALFNLMTSLTNEASPAYGDQLMLYDVDGAAADSITLSTLFGSGRMKLASYTGSGSSGKTVTLTGINRAYAIIIICTTYTGTSYPTFVFANGSTGTVVRRNGAGGYAADMSLSAPAAGSDQVLTINNTSNDDNRSGNTYVVLTAGTTN